MTNIQYKFADFVLLPNEGILTRNGEIIHLTYRAFKVLELMVSNAGRVVMKDEFMDTIWEGSFVEEGNLPVAVNAIRKVLHTDGKAMVETFSRRGYRFNFQVEKVIAKSHKLSTLIEEAQTNQTVTEHKVSGLDVRPTPNPAYFFPRLSKVVPARILQFFLPASPAKVLVA